MSIADQAKEVIYGDREKTYSDPSINLKRIAGMWQAYLGRDITPADVSNLMILMKVARLINTPDHEDSWVDIIGYTLLQERMKDAKAGIKVEKPSLFKARISSIIINLLSKFKLRNR